VQGGLRASFGRGPAERPHQKPIGLKLWGRKREGMGAHGQTGAEGANMAARGMVGSASRLLDSLYRSNIGVDWIKK
jgi:hypothetical protein